MTRHRPDLKETVLDAAEAVALSQGVARLTFDAVAAEAGVSKGGVLHHFASKEQLVEGLAQRAADNWRQYFLEAYERTSEGPGRMARAILESGFLQQESWEEWRRRSFTSLLAALTLSPELARPIREVHHELYSYLENDGLPEGVAEVIGSTLDGIWLHWASGFAERDEAFLRRVYIALKGLLDHSLKQ